MIERVVTVPSTNAELAQRVARGEPVREGQWLVADRQTSGRGRRGREWFDGAGNFMGSTVVRQAFGDPPLASLALVTGLAVQRVVASFVPHSRPFLKWPNDLYIGAAKCAGILIEQAGESAIIGVGVNLAAAPELPDRKTIALAALGATPDRDVFAQALADAFAEDLARWRTFGLGPVVNRWLAAAHPPGTPLVVGEPGDPVLAGTFDGLTEDGALLLRRPDGTRQTIHAGEVRLAGEA